MIASLRQAPIQNESLTKFASLRHLRLSLGSWCKKGWLITLTNMPDAIIYLQ